MTRTITSIEIYWDSQDPANEGWAYRASDDDGMVDSGAAGVEDHDLDGAIEDTCRQLGVELTPDMFAREPHLDGGFATWAADAD